METPLRIAFSPIQGEDIEPASMALTLTDDLTRRKIARVTLTPEQVGTIVAGRQVTVAGHVPEPAGPRATIESLLVEVVRRRDAAAQDIDHDATGQFLRYAMAEAVLTELLDEVVAEQAEPTQLPDPVELEDGTLVPRHQYVHTFASDAGAPKIAETGICVHCSNPATRRVIVTVPPRGKEMLNDLMCQSHADQAVVTGRIGIANVTVQPYTKGD